MAKKDDKVYEEYNVDLSLNLNSREELMKKAVETFTSEKPGYWKDGKKYVTRYKYFVEKLMDGRKIFLKRPTFLNKGIDFQVWVEKFDGENDGRPSHKDIFNDLKLKNNENSTNIQKLLGAINRVWNCEEPDKVLGDIDFEYQKGFSIEMLLKILKWLFIEQDITYWNYDGRTMLRMAIDEHLNQSQLKLNI